MESEKKSLLSVKKNWMYVCQQMKRLNIGDVKIKQMHKLCSEVTGDVKWEKQMRKKSPTNEAMH